MSNIRDLLDNLYSGSYTTGTESYSSTPISDRTREMYSNMIVSMFDPPSTMDGPCMVGQRKVSPFLVRSLDGKNYRIYFKTEFFFEARYINTICRFLDDMRPGNTVTFILGSKMDDSQTHVVGPVVAAIQSCRAKVIGIAAGYCSIPETMIWCYCHERDVYRYGALSFCKTDIISVCKAYTAYFETFFKRAIEIGVLTPETVKHIWESGNEYMILYNDYRNILEARRREEDANRETIVHES